MAYAGRKLRIKYKTVASGTATAIAGARTDSLTINREPIEVTDKDDAGVRTLMPDIGVWSMDANVEGVLTNGTLVALAADDSPTAAHLFDIAMPGIGTWAGSWFLGNFELTGEEGSNPTTFTCNIMSAGSITFTATA